MLVRVSHVALHPGASIMLSLIPFFFRANPVIAETDFSETVVEVGERVFGRLEAGTAVFGSALVGAHLKGRGALAEYVVVDKGMRMEDAVAGLGVSGCTALALMGEAELKEGQKVLISGANGGVGAFGMLLLSHAT